MDKMQFSALKLLLCESYSVSWFCMNMLLQFGSIVFLLFQDDVTVIIDLIFATCSIIHDIKAWKSDPPATLTNSSSSTSGSWWANTPMSLVAPLVDTLSRVVACQTANCFGALSYIIPILSIAVTLHSWAVLAVLLLLFPTVIKSTAAFHSHAPSTTLVRTNAHPTSSVRIFLGIRLGTSSTGCTSQSCSARISSKIRTLGRPNRQFCGLNMTRHLGNGGRVFESHGSH